ncbi:MAG: patatin-like phospholipase family protein, partial [Proteobacteria bacterium]|nr:patatin-like phospholipase family protein [Pseudomonadota bacterium]
MRRFVFLLFFISSVCSAGVGLVLSGGGAKGLAHIGVLKELDKAGIRIDYVVGTSMGCIIGGLYATGYSGEELEKIVLDEDWMGLFDDKPTRKYIPMYEKDESERYVGSFNLSPNRSFLPIGIISGQKVYVLLSRLTWNYEGIKNFRIFPIPVMCIATDLVKGDPVVLENGSLAEAMRASMSIPTIFTPVEIDGRLLVDGGVINNLPVSEAKKWGANFIIAVDAAGPAYKKEEIDSFFKVMEQVVGLTSQKERQKERKLANVLIPINTNKYTITDFDDAKTLIDIGQKAAEPYMAGLSKLPKEEKKNKIKKKVVHYKITSIRTEGLDKVSNNFIISSLGFSIPYDASQQDIEIAIEKIYGTQFFESVTYDIEPSFRGEYELIIKVKERSTSLLRFGFNYSSYTKASLLLNTTFKNMFIKDSRLSLDFNLSENPAFRTQYYMYSSRKPGFGFRSELLFNKFNIATFQNGGAQANYRFSYYALSLNVETNFSNYMLLGVGVDKEFTTRNPINASNQFTKSYDEFLTLAAFFRLDTLDSMVYPKKGIKID